MTDMRSPLGKMQGPEGSPSVFERQAKAFVKAGGAILLKHQKEALSAQAQAEIDAVMKKTYGK